MARKYNKKAAQHDDGTYVSGSTIDKPPRGEREPKEKPEKEAPKQESLFPGEPVQPRPLAYDKEVEFGLFVKITPPGKGTAVTLELYKGERAAGNVWETLLRALISEKWEDNGTMIDALLRLPADMEGPSKALLSHLRAAMKDFDRMGAAAAEESRVKAQADWRAKQDELKAKREAEKKQEEEARAKEKQPKQGTTPLPVATPPPVDGITRHGFEEGNVQGELLKPPKGKSRKKKPAEEATATVEVEQSDELDAGDDVGDVDIAPLAAEGELREVPPLEFDSPRDVSFDDPDF